MRQETAVRKIVESLKEEPCVKSIFLKGSMGRKEEDEHSDVDLYCMVDEEEKEAFLSRRLNHLKAYKDIIFYDDIFIVAPQIIAIYEDWLHIDLFTVTEATFQNKDYFSVLYDPEDIMRKYEATEKLTLSEEMFKDHVIDVAWFLFQFKKASERGNHIWASEMLQYAMKNLSNVMLYHYAKDRSQLGLKAIHHHLPFEKYTVIQEIYEHVTPSLHEKAAEKIISLLQEEFNWIASHFEKDNQTTPFLELMIKQYNGVPEK
ncbi:nucleotidyltransferase domain-containing protein [Pontibacillus yanchengensis]|uniref:Nucleotidyltransferase domain-containing protein n=1 Tax=Pontibacillus yanchengensis TaxID=462910 RepID=A0ACC7VH47_9BACI|nr:nucleotidyltransferase domain-containing protein [Pontibacillus yanchengensis]MYL54108.1 nucleotidyltransferase domain-containing protein [Pontibacillus yanchengensis]